MSINVLNEMCQKNHLGYIIITIMGKIWLSYTFLLRFKIVLANVMCYLNVKSKSPERFDVQYEVCHQCAAWRFRLDTAYLNDFSWWIWFSMKMTLVPWNRTHHVISEVCHIKTFRYDKRKQEVILHIRIFHSTTEPSLLKMTSIEYSNSCILSDQMSVDCQWIKKRNLVFDWAIALCHWQFQMSGVRLK